MLTFCRQSDEYVKHAYHLLMTQLEKQHSEIRLSSFLIVDELFHRSHCFRDELLGDFQYFLMLVAGTPLLSDICSGGGQRRFLPPDDGKSC